ncbi:flagellar hook-length control protein FliK [Aquicoccus porphyridii]|uniref:flagellar hook-length control protein FliK n=1 Tax=Aquicoccus porphyridii TaxID=1852029 RepID=UPI00273DB669|nr:flagellar hook-length control protein FliK [Aquicoccus porphyridii]
MTEITTHPAMAGRMANRPVEADPQKGASGVRADGDLFSDMVHARTPLAQPPANEPGKDREATEPDQLPPPHGENPEETRDTTPETRHDIPAQTAPARLALPRANIAGEALRSPGRSAVSDLAPRPVASAPAASSPVDRVLSSGQQEHLVTASRAGGADHPANVQRTDGPAIPAPTAPGMTAEHRATHSSPVPHHDIPPPAQVAARVASPIRPIAATGVGLSPHDPTDEHGPTPGADLKTAYSIGARAGTSPLLPPPSQRSLAPASRPALAPADAANFGAIRLSGGLDGREHATRSDPGAELSGLAGFEGIARETGPTGPLIARYGPDLPQHVARQIAEFAPGPQQATEVRLNPEELGRVRMTMVQSEGAISVTITAERGETLDLMRRHIGLLAEEFRQIGYGSIQFDFGPDRRGRDSGQPSPGDDPSCGAPGDDPDTPDQSAPPAPALSARIADGSIDIRL